MLWFVYIFVLGLIIGSFVNVVIYRLPLKRGIVFGRSSCVHCDKQIVWYDLVPLISYFFLRGRCRKCKSRISPIYPIIELYSGVIFVASLVLINSDLTPWFHVGRDSGILSDLITWLFTVFILEIFLMLAVIDFEHFILPDSLMIIGVIGTLVYGVWQKIAYPTGAGMLIPNGLFGAVVLSSCLFGIWFFSKGRGVGFGDVKLAGFIGLLFGLARGATIMYIAIGIGAIVGLIAIILSRANLKTKLPLGSFIGFSASLYIFFGHIIQNKIDDIFYLVPLILR